MRIISAGIFNDKKFEYDIEKVTEYVKNIVYGDGSGTYIAGSLVIYNPGVDQTDKDPKEMLCINIDHINNVEPELKELCYYSSLLYIKNKSKTASFYNMSLQNISQYKAVKKLTDFIEAGNE